MQVDGQVKGFAELQKRKILLIHRCDDRASLKATIVTGFTGYRDVASSPFATAPRRSKISMILATMHETGRRYLPHY